MHLCITHTRVLGREDGYGPGPYKDSVLSSVVGVLVSGRSGPSKPCAVVVAKSSCGHGSVMLTGSANDSVLALPMRGQNRKEANSRVV